MGPAVIYALAAAVVVLLVSTLRLFLTVRRLDAFIGKADVWSQNIGGEVMSLRERLDEIKPPSPVSRRKRK